LKLQIESIEFFKKHENDPINASGIVKNNDPEPKARWPNSSAQKSPTLSPRESLK